ncbi:hypothetical protein BTUL_0015g01050 [Botrytis tulipae]|uniref:Uncharacterized protein n=1 Tax=Botrytis tulipae TaxID=87230 RepID=A0A4Z1F2F1_9HELO|nr:hypothetical protein BTUL_0015g01050 [Botrytis tulipae]
MKVKEGDSTMLGAEEENQAVAGVGEEYSENFWEARYSNVRFSKNMTSEELLESLKNLIGPGAEDEKKRRVIKWTQTEKGRRKAAESQARNKKKIEKIKRFQMRREINMAKNAQRAERREIAEAKLRWDAEHPEEAAKRRENNKGARKRAAQKAKKRLRAESQKAREMGLSTATDRHMMKSDAARGVGEEAVEGDALNAEKIANDDSDVNAMKGLDFSENLTFSLAIREK